MTNKPLVLLVGGAGNTGRVVSRRLLEEGNYRVAILAREKSANKPIYQELKSAGAEIRIGDASDTPASLEAILQGVDVLISLVLVMTVDQKPLFRAAKKVGVGRVVPSDFGPTAPRGVMTMHDLKLDIRDYIKDLGLPYTFVEVGLWWLQSIFPFPHSTPETAFVSKHYIGDRQQKLLVSTLESIGVFMARIMADPRTLNQTVIVYDRGSQPVGDLGSWSRDNRRGFLRLSKSTVFDRSDEDVKRSMQSSNPFEKINGEVENVLFLRGDNVFSAALSRGALDVRALYPDVPPFNLREEAERFYANLPVPDYDFADIAASMKISL